MTGVFLSAPRYDWCAPLLHPSSCMLLNYGPSQQSSKEEYKHWKWGASQILHISYKDHVTNEEIRAKIQQAIGPHEDLLTIVKRRKVQCVWSCLPFIRSGQNHLARHSERGKKTRQTEEEVGRQHQGMEFAKFQRAVENRETWRKLGVKSSVLLQRPSRLRH